MPRTQKDPDYGPNPSGGRAYGRNWFYTVNNPENKIANVPKEDFHGNLIKKKTYPTYTNAIEYNRKDLINFKPWTVFRAIYGDKRWPPAPAARVLDLRLRYPGMTVGECNKFLERTSSKGLKRHCDASKPAAVKAVGEK